MDGVRAAGVQIGDSEATVMKQMGGPPTRTEEFEKGARRDLIYVAEDPRRQWALAVGIVFRRERVWAVWIVTSRVPGARPPYEGLTSRGYRMGEGPARLRALYGAPDEIITDLGTQMFWWYRAAGLVVAPEEVPTHGQVESNIVVVDARATRDDVRRLLHIKGS